MSISMRAWSSIKYEYSRMTMMIDLVVVFRMSIRAWSSIKYEYSRMIYYNYSIKYMRAYSRMIDLVLRVRIRRMIMIYDILI